MHCANIKNVTVKKLLSGKTEFSKNSPLPVTLSVYTDPHSIKPGNDGYKRTVNVSLRQAYRFEK